MSPALSSGIDYKTKYIVLDEETIKLQIWYSDGVLSSDVT